MCKLQTRIQGEINALLNGDDSTDKIRNYYNALETSEEKDAAFEIILEQDPDLASNLFYQGNAAHTAFQK